MEKPAIFSWFSGAGFLDLGFEDAGYQIAFVNEIHQPFLDAYKYSRKKLKKEEPLFGYHNLDASLFLNNGVSTTLRSQIKQLRKQGTPVGFIGGPPCPDFSVGGKNQGRNGDRGKLSEVYIQLICKYQPDFFLFENVKGLWQTKKHRAFYDELKHQNIDAGYYYTDRLVNAIEYGTPQDRERIIFVGFKDKFLHDLDIDFQLHGNELMDCFPWKKYIKYPNGKAFHYEWPTQSPFEEDSEIPKPENIPAQLTVEHWFKKNKVENHPNSEHCFKPHAGLKRFQTVDEGDDKKKSYKRLHRWRYSPTACYGNNEVHLHPYKARRISVAEALAIQGLPSKFELKENMKLSDMFKTVGNGVPYDVALSISKLILKFCKII